MSRVDEYKEAEQRVREALMKKDKEVIIELYLQKEFEYNYVNYENTKLQNALRLACQAISECCENPLCKYYSMDTNDLVEYFTSKREEVNSD